MPSIVFINKGQGKWVVRAMTDQQFGELVAQYERLVYSICYQFTRNHHTAEDLMQDAFVSAYTHIDSCPEGNEKPWFCRIATNKAKDFLKSAYNRRVLAADDEIMPDNAQPLFIQKEEPEDITLQKEEVEKIQADIRAMKEPYLKVAVLFFLEEKTVEEIAQILSRPPKTINTQLYRAKKALREKLKEPHIAQDIEKNRKDSVKLNGNIL